VSDPIKEPFQFRVYNFEQMSDLSASDQILLTPDHILEKADISFVLKNMSEPFYAGNRVFLELGFLNAIPGMNSLALGVHVDYRDREIPPVPFDWKSLVLYITIPSFGTIAALVVIISTYYYLKEDEE
jgi:hypothetical protein